MDRSEELDEGYGLNLIMFEDRFYKIIEDIIVEHWGVTVAEVIFWWVYTVKDPKSGEYFLLEQSSNKKAVVKTPTQLYNTIKKFKLFKTTENGSN